VKPTLRCFPEHQSPLYARPRHGAPWRNKSVAGPAPAFRGFTASQSSVNPRPLVFLVTGLPAAFLLRPASRRLRPGVGRLPQRGLAELFPATTQNVSLHMQHIFAEGEMGSAATVKQYLTLPSQGNREIRRAVDHDDLDIITAVGLPREVLPRHAVPQLGCPGTAEQLPRTPQR
jgi:hypothetical protein